VRFEAENAHGGESNRNMNAKPKSSDLLQKVLLSPWIIFICRVGVVKTWRLCAQKRAGLGILGEKKEPQEANTYLI
jgi:hypothetical protein